MRKINLIKLIPTLSPKEKAKLFVADIKKNKDGKRILSNYERKVLMHSVDKESFPEFSHYILLYAYAPVYLEPQIHELKMQIFLSVGEFHNHFREKNWKKLLKTTKCLRDGIRDILILKGVLEIIEDKPGEIYPSSPNLIKTIEEIEKLAKPFVEISNKLTGAVIEEYPECRKFLMPLEYPSKDEVQAEFDSLESFTNEQHNQIANIITENLE